MDKTCSGCDFFADPECRRFPPQVVAVVLPAKTSSIAGPNGMGLEVQIHSAYPRPGVRCGQYIGTSLAVATDTGVESKVQ